MSQRVVKQDDGQGRLPIAPTGVAVVPTVLETVGAFLRLELAGKSGQTRLWYERRLAALGQWLGEGRPIGDVMEGEIGEYYAHLAGRKSLFGKSRPAVEGGLSAFTLHGHVRAMRRFFRWCYKKAILPADLSLDLDLPKLPKQGRKGISEGNLRAILAEAKAFSARDYALLRFLESTGVRRGGIEGLVLSDLNLDQADERLRRRASVREKGEKERTVVMSREALGAVEIWLRERPAIDDGHVFLGHSPGQAWHPLSAQGISGIVARYKNRLGLRGPCSPHQWRHRFARNMLHRGMELAQVSQLLGHEDVSITVRFYGQFDIDQLQDAYDRYCE